MNKSLFLALLVIFNLPFIFALTDISSCSKLDKTGETYRLTKDILNSGVSRCIDITANNVILDCQGHKINGMGPSYGINIERGNISDTRVIIKNCQLTGWSASAINIVNSNSNSLTNLSLNNNYDSGIFLIDSSNNQIENSNISINPDYGIYSRLSNNNSISNSIIKSNLVDGIFLGGANNRIFFNVFEGNGNGIFLDGSNNFIYNNFFNNAPHDVWISFSASNKFNTALQPGTRIFSPGTNIGGNFWADPSKRMGYSQTCADANTDGFCDSPYVLADNNIDYLPLSDKYVAKFIRGDANMNGRVDISDPVYMLNALFKNDPVRYPVKCQDAIDANDDGKMDVADTNYLLAYLFKNGLKPKAPFPTPGTDPTADGLNCAIGL